MANDFYDLSEKEWEGLRRLWLRVKSLQSTGCSGKPVSLARYIYSVVLDDLLDRLTWCGTEVELGYLMELGILNSKYFSVSSSGDVSVLYDRLPKVSKSVFYCYEYLDNVDTRLGNISLPDDLYSSIDFIEPVNGVPNNINWIDLNPILEKDYVEGLYRKYISDDGICIKYIKQPGYGLVDYEVFESCVDTWGFVLP